MILSCLPGAMKLILDGSRFETSESSAEHGESKMGASD